MLTHRSWMYLTAALLLALSTSLTQAQSWPTKPVRLIVPFPAGGASDIVARMLGEKLTSAWGQPVVMENRPGAGGTIATAEMLRTGNDAHTLMIGTMGTHAVAPNLYRSLSYEPSRDLAPVAALVQTPMVLVADPQLPAGTMAEFVALAKAHPGKYSIASPGNGTLNHLMGEVFKQDAGISMEHIPYKGSVAAYPDLMAGRVAVMFDPIPTAVPAVQKGNLKALAVSHSVKALPGVPTMAEAGFPDLGVALWVGLFAPSTMPADIVTRISADVVKAMRSPDIVERIDGLGSQVTAIGHADFAPSYAADLKRWGQVVDELKITID